MKRGQNPLENYLTEKNVGDIPLTAEYTARADRFRRRLQLGPRSAGGSVRAKNSDGGERGADDRKALSKASNPPLPTIYRRVSTVDEHGLPGEETVVDTRDDLADNFTDLWSGIRGEER